MPDNFSQRVARAALRLSYDQPVENRLMRAAAEIYLQEYDPNAIVRPVRQYVGPHVPPGNHALSKVSGNGD